MSAAARLACISQPLSWLVLERHALEELQGAAASAAADHLAECAACAAAFGSIRADRRALPALPDIVRLELGQSTRAPADLLSKARAKRRQWAIGAGVFVAAAAALLLVVLRPKDVPGGELSASVRVKGAGVVVMTLVRERDGAVAFDPIDVRESDRWKVQLTCAPGGRATVEVVVYQAAEPAAVSLPSQSFACGNDIVIPGAFRITGGAATICARLSDASLPPLPATPGGQMACRRVAP